MLFPCLLFLNMLKSYTPHKYVFFDFDSFFNIFNINFNLELISCSLSVLRCSRAKKEAPIIIIMLQSDSGVTPSPLLRSDYILLAPEWLHPLGACSRVTPELLHPPCSRVAPSSLLRSHSGSWWWWWGFFFLLRSDSIARRMESLRRTSGCSSVNRDKILLFWFICCRGCFDNIDARVAPGSTVQGYQP